MTVSASGTDQASWTEKGAEVLSVIVSTCWTICHCLGSDRRRGRQRTAETREVLGGLMELGEGWNSRQGVEWM